MAHYCLLLGRYHRTVAGWRCEATMLKAFILGMIEFRSSFTTNCGKHQRAYDWGREWAHRLTLRRYDN